jgi:hypothetical protein
VGAQLRFIVGTPKTVILTGWADVSALMWLEVGAKLAVRTNWPPWLDEKVPAHCAELGETGDNVVQPTNWPPLDAMLSVPLMGTGLSVSGSDNTAWQLVETPTSS